MAGILMRERFKDVDHSMRIFTNQRYDLYRVYGSREHYVDVEATTAAEAFKRSGISVAWRIEHRLPPFKATALKPSDILTVRHDEDIHYTLPPETVLDVPEHAQEFVAMEYAAFGKEQHEIKQTRTAEAIADGMPVALAISPDEGLTPEQVQQLLDQKNADQ